MKSLLIVTQVVDKNDPILGFFHGWIEEFAQQVEKIDVICLRKGEYDFGGNDVCVHELGKRKNIAKILTVGTFYIQFARLLFNRKPEAVFFHMGGIFPILAAPFFAIRNMLKTRFLWWKAHGHINYIGALALKFVDVVYTSTESGFAIATPKRKIIGQGIDTDLFVPPSVKNILSTNISLLTIARIAPIKRIEDCLDVVFELTKLGYSVTYTVIGTVFDEKYFAKLTQRIIDLDIEDFVNWVGAVDNVALPKYCQKADLLLNPSETDSMDKVVLEAMACGAIPVTSNRAFKDTLSPHGLMVEKRNIREYVSVIQRLVAQAPEDQQNLRAELRDIVVQQHSLRGFISRIVNARD